jgi:hypothetical protein
MYLLTIRDGLQTRHIGPYASPRQAADHLDQLLGSCGERAHWQIHVLESPEDVTRVSTAAGGEVRAGSSALAA